MRNLFGWSDEDILVDLDDATLTEIEAALRVAETEALSLTKRTEEMVQTAAEYDEEGGWRYMRDTVLARLISGQIWPGSSLIK